MMEEADSQLLADFFSANSIDDARRASAPLLQTPVAARLAKEPGLRQAIAHWWSRAVDPENADRLEVLALLWRLTALSAMSAHRRDISAEMRSGFEPNLPHLSTLIDPKDRRAAAEALFLAPQNAWLAEYAARSIVSDPDPKSDARDAMSAVLLRQTGNIGTAFNMLAEGIANLTLNQQDPTTGRARRLTWILRSFRDPLHDDEDAVAEPSFGPAFDKFVSRGLGDIKSVERSAFIDGAREVLLALNSVVRLHGLTVATDAGTYAAVEALRRKFESTEWPDPLRQPIRRLSIRVAEALIVLARQGIADAGLRRVFGALVGSSFANARLRHIVEGIEGLSPEIAYWLETGGTRERLETASAIEETATSMVDLEIARALREAFLADEAIDVGQSPDMALRRMAREMREAARKRGIVIRGMPGDTVDLSPIEHEVDQSVIGCRKVTLVTPLVERLAGDRSLGVLIKAQVRPGG